MEVGAQSTVKVRNKPMAVTVKRPAWVLPSGQWLRTPRFLHGLSSILIGELRF